MQYQEFYAVHAETGQVLPGATVTVRKGGSPILAQIFDKDGNPKPNPFRASSVGLAGMAAADGAYDIQFVLGAYTAPPITKVMFFDPVSLVDTATGIVARTEAVAAAGNLWPSVAKGLENTDPGRYFSVPSASSDAAVDLYLNDAGAAVFTGKSAPTLQLVNDIMLTSGEQIDRSRTDGQVFEGATLIIRDGKQRGFTVPAGRTGAATYATSMIHFDRDESARLDGKRIRIQAVYAATTGFLAEIPITGTYMQLFSGGNIGNNTGSLISFRQVGGQVILEVEQDWLAQYNAVGPTLQLQGTNGSKAYSFELTSISYRVVGVPGASSDADATIRTAYADALEGGRRRRIMAMRPRYDAEQVAQMFNGVTPILDGTRTVGMSVPPGATGQPSYILHSFELGAQPWPLAGERVRVRAVMDVSAGFNRAMAIVGQTYYGDGNASRDLPLTEGSSTVNENNQVVQEGIMTLVGDETYLRPYVQIVGGPVVEEAPQTVRINRLEIEFLRDDPGLSAYEKNLRMQQHFAVQRTKRNLRLGYSDAMGEGFRGGVEANGGKFHRDADGRIDGWVVPAGFTGNATYFQIQSFVPEFKSDLRYKGRHVRMAYLFETSPNYQREVGLVIQVMFNGLSQNRLTGVNLSHYAVVAPGWVYMEGTYKVVGDEDELRPFFERAFDTVSSESRFIMRAAQYTFLDDSTDPASLGGEALTTFLRDRRNMAALEAKAAPSVGSLKAYGQFMPQFFNSDSQLIVAGKKVHGWSIQPASVGAPTLLQYVLNWGTTGGLSLAGRVMRLSFRLRLSVPYTRSFQAVVAAFGPSGQVDVGHRVVNDVVTSGGTRRLYEVEFTLNGSETGIGPYLSNLYGLALSGQTETLEVVDVEARIVYSPDGEAALRAENQALALRYALYQASQTSTGGEPPVLHHIYKDPATGLMPSFVDTLAALDDASAARRYEIVHHGGVQRASDNSFQMRRFVDIRGLSRETAVFAAGIMPANVGLVDMQYDQSMYFNDTGRLYNVTILGKNCRYPVHSDSGGSIRDFVQEIENCYIEHLGNDEARAWQAANGGNPNAVWSSEHAWGCGNSSGSRIHFRRTELRSPTSPLYWHTNGMFERPSLLTADDCYVICTKAPGVGPGTYSAIYVQPLGSFQPDEGVINNCLVSGDVVYDPYPWIATGDLAHQCANHAEIRLSGAGNSGVHAFRHVDRLERALRITSTDTTNSSSIEISGTAVPVLFGDGTLGPAVYSKPGAGGIRGYVYGWNDVGNGSRGYPVMDISVRMGSRLGNCTGVNKTLTVKVNGGATVTHTFNQDYTNQSNADILTQINATLGSAAVADLFNPTMLYRPSWFDQESASMNNSAVGIPMGSVVAHHESGFGVRLMTAADSRLEYAGVAWEDIYPGKVGRVKSAGHLFLTDVLRTDGTADVAVGDTFSIAPEAPGKAFKGGAQRLLSAVRSNVVAVALKG